MKEGFNSATQKLEGMTGKAHVAAQSGRLIEGIVSQKYELPHGPFAMIKTQRAFYLVPWESHHTLQWGKRFKGRVLSGGGIDWDVGRSRGIGRRLQFGGHCRRKMVFHFKNESQLTAT